MILLYIVTLYRKEQGMCTDKSYENNNSQLESVRKFKRINFYLEMANRPCQRSKEGPCGLGLLPCHAHHVARVVTCRAHFFLLRLRPTQVLYPLVPCPRVLCRRLCHSMLKKKCTTSFFFFFFLRGHANYWLSFFKPMYLFRSMCI